MALVETVISEPAAAAPRAVASSPSGCAMPWYAQGATPMGERTGEPSSSVASGTAVMPFRTRGRSRQDRQAPGASRSVVSVSAPPA